MFNFKKYLLEENNFENFSFLEEIIQIIFKKKDLTTIDGKKNIFFENCIELLKILFLSIKINENLSCNKNFENIFISYFLFLKEQKFIFSQYLIIIKNNKSVIYNMTIFEICIDIFISLSYELKNNIFEKYFINDNIIQNFIFKNPKLKDNNFINEDLKKYLKNKKLKKNEKPLFIIVINKLIEYIIKNQQNNKSISLISYLNSFIEIIKKNYKGFEKKNEITKIIIDNKNNKDNYKIINSMISINQKSIKTIIEKEKSFFSVKENNKNGFNKFIMEENQNECPLKKNCLLIKNIINKENISSNKKDVNFKTQLNGDYIDLNLPNITICLKRDLLLKDCSVYFKNVYFKDKNFMKIKKHYFYNFANNKSFNLKNELDKFDYPTKIKNYSNNIYAYPHIFLKPYTSFYDRNEFNITHPYFNRESIKIPSFPFVLSHYYSLKTIIDNYTIQIYFKIECEAIMKTNIICGNIILMDYFLYFINDNEIIKQYGKNIKYLFSSIINDIKQKNKIIIIKYKDIQEIISRRYIYDYRACEIFLKDGKSFYFNFYSKENLNSFFNNIEKITDNFEYNYILIKEPIKYFSENLYYEKWLDDKISTYQYLLYINKFSSRSYNDINQYPIFPWVFMESKKGSYCFKYTLPDLRDMSFPISIKNEEDIKDAIFYFTSSMKEKNKYPSHYRIHYSTSYHLISYLVRLFPFTEEHINYFNNQLDNPNRQIESIDGILNLLPRHDNRELIPEFFTTAEFLLNLNYIFFGYKTRDKTIINDIQYPEKFFNSFSQYIYYNRLLLDKKIYLSEFENPEKLVKINYWIDLIFGCEQWNKLIKKTELNLFPKYCYKQNIDFEKILKKYKEKGFNNKEIIRKIELKKLNIILFGQCPEILFKNKSKFGYLNNSIEDKLRDELALNYLFEIDINGFEKKINKNFIISTFCLTENNEYEYIYYLVFEEYNDDITHYILIYKNNVTSKDKPDFIININEINLLNIKISKIKNSYKTYYYNYQLDPKSCLFDIYIKNIIYFFVGRNPDNSIKIYEVGKEKDNKGKLKYVIPTDSFVSCLYKKDKNIFFSGHKNGKLFEWKITYNLSYEKINKKKIEIEDKILKIELIRDIIAHKSMICCINYIKKHNILITSSYDGNIFIRKYYDFELLSAFETKQLKTFVKKIIYTDYDLLYLLICYKDKKYLLNSSISLYTLNGLLIESSSFNNFIDIEPLKNGKIICNINNQNSLQIFGLNQKNGTLNKYNYINEYIRKYMVRREGILNFTYSRKNNFLYVLLEDKSFIGKRVSNLNDIFYNIDKFKSDFEKTF